MGTLAYQSSRGSGLFFLDKYSEFMVSFSRWLYFDSNSVYFALILNVVFLVLFIFRRTPGAIFIFLMNLIYILFSIRGKLYLDFYVIPYFYIYSIMLGVTIDSISKIKIFRIKKEIFHSFSAVISIFILVFFLGNYFVYASVDSSYNENKPFQDATDWLIKNVDENSSIVVDNGMMMGLRIPNKNEKYFKNTVWYIKYEFDKEIYEDKFKNNEENVDYVVGSYNIENNYSNDYKNSKVTKLLLNSKLVADFSDKEGMGFVKSKIYKKIKDKKSISLKHYNYLLQKIETEGIEKLKLDSFTFNQIIELTVQFKDLNNFNKLQQRFYLDYIENNENYLVNQDGLYYIYNLINGSKQFGLDLNERIDLLNNTLQSDFKINIGEYEIFKSTIDSTRIELSKINPLYLLSISKFKNIDYSKIISSHFQLLKRTMQENNYIPEFIELENDGTTIKSINNTSRGTNNILYNLYELTQSDYNKELPIKNNFSQELKKYLELYSSYSTKQGYMAKSYFLDGNPDEGAPTLENDLNILSLYRLTNYENQFKFWRNNFIQSIDLDVNCLPYKSSIQDLAKSALFLNLENRKPTN